MNPFELPPSTPPVGFDPPSSPSSGRRRRGVMAAVALTSAGLVAGGVVVVSQLASADEPSFVPSAAPQPGDETVATTIPPPDTTEPEATDPDTTGPVLDGQITIDVGEGDPITIDLGALSDLGNVNELQECLGLPGLEIGGFEPGDHEFPRFPQIFEHGGVFGDGHVVVTGPDGVSVVDFGDGDGSVTITKSGDEISVESEGDVTVNEPGQVLYELPEMPDLPEISFPELPDLDKIQECLDAAGA